MFYSILAVLFLIKLFEKSICHAPKLKVFFRGHKELKFYFEVCILPDCVISGLPQESQGRSSEQKDWDLEPKSVNKNIELSKNKE